jgi:hypothetical protein
VLAVTHPVLAASRRHLFSQPDQPAPISWPD